MVEIEYCRLKGTYKILWLRYVYGVDLSQHCMKSLLGHNDKRVKGYMREIPRMELEDSRFYYLCGVDKNFVWAKNLHLAFIPCAGFTIEIDNPFIQCKINNAKQFFFSSADIDWKLSVARNSYYNTCRNWQFANKIAKIPGVVQAPIQRRLF